jgi:glucosyl-3-phosphoglycerate synthase
MKQVSLGSITNDMQPLMDLSKMSREVSKAIFKRANVGPYKTLETMEYINVIREQMEFAVKEAVKELKKMIVFDMDNTLIKGSFIHQLAKAKGFEKELGDIVVQNNNDFMRTKRIAQLLKGIPYAEMLAVVDEIPLVEDAEQVIAAFRERGYVCGIISDSYDCIAHHIKVKLNMDFALANELEFSKSVATGEVKIPSYYLKEKKSTCEHDYCKSNVLMHVASNYGIELKNSIAVGDAENDICMFNAAGIGVAFNARSKMVEQFADVVVVAGSFAKIIEIAAD